MLLNSFLEHFMNGQERRDFNVEYSTTYGNASQAVADPEAVPMKVEEFFQKLEVTMAKKRGGPRKTASLDALVAELRQLDERRMAVVGQIRDATNRLLSGENPFPWGAGRNVKASSDGGMVSSGRKRKRREMSAAQRRVVSARMKKYWAERRKAQGASK
jgi:hypothetical protein